MQIVLEFNLQILLQFNETYNLRLSQISWCCVQRLLLLVLFFLCRHYSIFIQERQRKNNIVYNTAQQIWTKSVTLKKEWLVFIDFGWPSQSVCQSVASRLPVVKMFPYKIKLEGDFLRKFLLLGKQWQISYCRTGSSIYQERGIGCSPKHRRLLSFLTLRSHLVRTNANLFQMQRFILSYLEPSL
jgi:hypothetical protein